MRKRVELAPAHVNWRGIAASYTTVQLLYTAIWGLVWTALLAVPLILVLIGVWHLEATWWVWLLPSVSAAFLLLDLILVPRRMKAMGYAEESTQFWLRKGLLFRHVSVVAYARIQYVDIRTGPLLSAFGLATVVIHTASAGTDATIPGVAREEADRLREMLTRRGENLMVGL